ncbi:MAG: hypothetical protein WA875_14525 [Candidatus Acidiferrales bacterium]
MTDHDVEQDGSLYKLRYGTVLMTIKFMDQEVQRPGETGSFTSDHNPVTEFPLPLNTPIPTCKIDRIDADHIRARFTPCMARIGNALGYWPAPNESNIKLVGFKLVSEKLR